MNVELDQAALDAFLSDAQKQLQREYNTRLQPQLDALAGTGTADELVPKIENIVRDLGAEPDPAGIRKEAERLAAASHLPG
jgi:hypothetical protein